MEAVALHTLLAEACGDGVGEGLGRHGGVECGVEAGEGGRLRVELRCSVDERQGGRDVERCEMDGAAQGIENLRGDAAVLAQMRAAMDDAVSDGLRLSVAELLEFLHGVGEGARLRIVRGVFAVDGFASGVGDGERAAGFADSVSGTAIEELRFACGITIAGAIEAELEGRGAAVDRQDVGHGRELMF